MEIIKGTGNLYDADGKQALSTVAYQIWWEPPTECNHEEWRGEFAADQEVLPLGEHVIELEDGQRGNCLLVRETIARLCVFPIAYSYSFEGIGALGQQKEIYHGERHERAGSQG